MRGLTTLLVTLALSMTVSTQAGSQVVPPLPAGERIGDTPPPSVTLRLSPNRVAIGEVPTFTVVIRNRSRAPLLLNATAVSNIQIFTQSGALVAPSRESLVEYVGSVLKRSDFVALGPGQTREFQVRPEYHALNDYFWVST